MVTFRHWVITALGVLTALAAGLFVLAPVDEDGTSYHWPHGSDARSAALPLFPGEPQTIEAAFGCADVHALDDAGGLLLSTTAPADVEVEQRSAGGLAVTVTDSAVTVRLDGRAPLVRTQPVGESCSWTVRSGANGTSVSLDGAVVGHTTETPLVTGLFTDLRGSTGLDVTVVPDTRYASTPSMIKVALGLATLAGVVALLVLVSRWEAPRVPRARLLPRGWWRPRGPDVAVAVTLLAWMLVGSPTVDDGYIIAMLKAADESGFIGNYFRWFNAPEAPFSWFYEVYRPFAELSGSAWWMRLPSVLLGLVLWLLVDRLLLGRLATGPTRLVRWCTAAVFAMWYVQFGVGLRPEPWVMLGTVLVFVLVERAVALRALTPLAAAVVAAGATVAVTPTGVVALVPFVAALPALVRVVRRYRRVAAPVLLGSAASALLLMFADQSLSAVLHSTEVRTAIGPSFGVLDEPRRYEDVFDPMHGGLNRQMPLLLLWLSMAVLTVLLLARRAPGLAKGPTRRALVVTALFFVALAFTPTKYTHHFGAIGAIATVLVAAVVHTVARGALRRAWQYSLFVLALTAAVSVAFAAPVRWWFLANLAVPWSQDAPDLGGVALSDAVLVGGVLLAVTGLAGAGRLLPTTGWLLTLTAGCTVVLEVASMAYPVVPRWNTYSLGKANIAAFSGGCGVEDWVRVEPNPRAGLLDTAADSPPARLGGFTRNGGFPSDVGPTPPYGTSGVPVWGSDGAEGTLTTGWYELPEGAGSPDSPPLVIPVGGNGAVRAKVQFADADGIVDRENHLYLDDTGAWREARFDPGEAERVRVVAVDRRDDDDWIAVGAPRLPEVVPLAEHIPVSEPVVLDWVNAFFLPCRQPASVAHGVIQPVRYRLASGPESRWLTGMSFVRESGGPYAPLLEVADQTPVPTYLRGDKLHEPISVFRLDYPVPPLGALRVDSSSPDSRN